ncbi:MAG: triose-phosphate isomerase [candidate division KSB1 bacterium]|nr:triose-phosphate isomerase [candidate division KSB1 bacterium]MDZ7304411.1 triose-phosphate isomerase [candidate division KSB1 bacterium]MDZ7313361.1 triose-phosphate isomerase [candidate division KSB1 bacterium]
MTKTPRKMFIAGNWKMFTTPAEAAALVKALKVKVINIHKVEMAVCPPFTNLTTVAELLKGTAIKLGAQNLFWEEEGAYTGEISAKMLLGAGCEYVIIGHSERRQYFGETDDTVNRRLKQALKAGLKPIVCVGETLAQRQAGETEKVVGTQVRGAFSGISPEDFAKVVIAYEPVWAIGTGVNATPEQAQEMQAFIRRLIENLYNRELSVACRIQYGGSVKPANAAELMRQPDVDGALVGGASLQAESFAAIIKAAEDLDKN